MRRSYEITLIVCILAVSAMACSTHAAVTATVIQPEYMKLIAEGVAPPPITGTGRSAIPAYVNKEIDTLDLEVVNADDADKDPFDCAYAILAACGELEQDVGEVNFDAIDETCDGTCANGHGIDVVVSRPDPIEP